MGLLASIFGAPKAIEAIAGTAGKLIDDAFKGDDERRAEAQSKVMDQTIEWMRASQSQNVARRLLALMVVGVWLGGYVVSTLLWVAAIWTDAYAVRLQQSAEKIGVLSTEMNPYVGLVLGFYFAGRVIGQWVDKGKGK